MAQLLTLRLSRQDAQPWGFRLQGGKDFGTPLVVQKVNGGSIAEHAGLIPGDAVIKINNVEVFNLRHKDAQDVVVRSGNTFDVTVQRGGSTWRPAITPVGNLPSHASLGNSPPTVTRTSLAHRPQEVRHIGSGYNSSARPFSSVNGGDGHVKSIVNKQYNSPVGIYSEEAIAETLSAQAEVLAGGVLGVNFKKNEKVYNSANSEVYKFLHEQEEEPSEPAERPYTQSVQHSPQSANHQTTAHVTRHVSAPIDRPKAPSTGGLPAGQNICADCERLIVGVFVRVKDRNLHVDCFKCATCGTSLKNQGYYNFNNKLYCDIHAKLAALNNPPPGTEGYVPVPIKPNTKLSASTISAALSSHHHQSNGTSHLITSPTSNTDPGSGVALPFQPSHSRTSSSSSSVGTTNSCISSLSPNMSSTPEKLSPVHSRQSSGSGTLVGGAGGPNSQHLKIASVPPTTVCTMSGNETTINHKQNENDMNSNNRNTSNGGGHGAPQTNAYNQFLKEYANKKTTETTDGGDKSLTGDTNGNSIAINMISRGGATNGNTEKPTAESLYGSIRADTKIQPHEDFQYVTLDGSLIKSVIPPGKGIKTNYKVHQGYGGPKPFNTAPKTPPISGPRSPAAYPPSQAHSWAQPKPATNPYATLPRTGSSQEECLDQSYEYHKKEEHHYEDDLEVAQATRTSSTVGSVIWPPPLDDRLTPTATPLYIAPPETQHVKPKYIQKIDNQQQQHKEKREIHEEDKHAIMSTEHQQQEQFHEQQQYQHEQLYQQQQQHQKQQQLQWQSRSAPELTSVKQHVELESGSDSYTSTCTTTTTASEEYQRMYQAQVQAYQQMQQMYEHSGSEMDYHMDMEVAAMQQQQDHSYSTSSEFLSVHSGRRSAQECAETISGPLSTYKLVGLVREVTPSPTPPAKGPRKVEFADDIDRKDEKGKLESILKNEQSKAEMESKEKQTVAKNDLEKVVKIEEDIQIERKFQPTPEIKIEIPEPKTIPPSNIPNPVPKEWISPMVKALTTAPDKPVMITDVCPSCPCNTPCETTECKCKAVQERQQELEPKKVESRPEILNEVPPKGSFIAKVVSTAPTDEVKFAPKSDEPVSLPEETEPYMPAPIDMKPYEREDFRPKSPLLKALITAPDRSYSPLGKGVCSQLDDLPRPKGQLTMVDALTVAPDRCYTPLNPENILNLSLNKQDKQTKSAYGSVKETEWSVQKENIDSQMDHQISAFASFSGQRSTTSFQPKTDPITPTNPQSLLESSSALSETCCRTSCTQQTSQALQQQNLIQSNSSIKQQQQSMYQSNSSIKQQQSMHQLSSYQSMKQSQIQQSSSVSIQQTSSKSECQKTSQNNSQKVSFPPSPGPSAKKALISGLHKPDNIPQYQRNWTVLPSQRPVKTPEPPELRENVPLAFVDIPREPSPNVEIPVAAQLSAYSNKSSTSVAVSDATRSSESKQKHSTVPIIIEDRSGPITMTFQSIDNYPEHHEDHSQLHPRPFTPSIINKPAPIVPFYQTPDKLVIEECSARSSQPFDRRSVSPCPERAKSPAPGPPPNPLNAIRAPRIKGDEIVPMHSTQIGSITTGQPYLGTQLMQQKQQQGQLLSHYQAVSQTGSQSFVDKPEVVQEKRVGDMQIQTREKESQLNEGQRSQLESKTTTQIGNAQIERRRKVVEEYEHTQKAKTIEIRKTSGETHQYGKTGYVANQTSRLSGLEKEISSLTSQSKAISARAATLGQEERKFPEYKSPEPESKFPTKKFLPSYDEPQKQPSFLSSTASKQMSAPGYQARQEQSTTAASSSYAALSESQSSTSQSFLTNSNPSSASNFTTAIPVPAFKPPMPSSGGGVNLYDNSAQPTKQPSSNNNTYRPTPSTGPAGFKPPPSQEPPNTNPSANISHTTPASTGASKGGAFGATSAPKRGRGILNKAVGPGVRIPLCGCCNAQVRGPFITALGRIWCPEHFICVNANCRRPLQDIGFVEEKGDLYCEYCFEKYLAPTCSKCNSKIKGDCLNAIGKHFHPECFTCTYCGKLFGNSPFFLEEGEAYCEADWNELFTTKCFACGFPVEAGDRWVEALNHNYHSQCFNCTMCKKNLEGQSFYNKGGRPFCKNHAR